MPTISLAMIVRDVEAIIGSCLGSVVPFVHEVVIVDTGSQDATKQMILAKAPRAKIFDYNPQTHPDSFLLDVEATWPEKLPGEYSGKMLLANFGGARQYGLDRCTSDYVLWIDSDDVLVNGEKLHELVQEMQRDQAETAMLAYEYETDKNGNVTCELIRERIVKRRPEVVWCQPIHEVICPTFSQRNYKNVVVRHRRHEYGLKSPFAHRNLKVLLHWFKTQNEDTCDPRMLFYLAMEEQAFFPERAIEHYRKYCERSGSDAERAKAHLYSGKIHEFLAFPKGKDVVVSRLGYAFAEYCQAAMDASFDPDPFFYAARIAYYQKRFDKCIEWTERGFEAMKNKDGRIQIFQFNPLERKHEPHVYYSFSLIKHGRYQEALKVCEEGLKWNPTDVHLIGNKEFLEKYFAEQNQKAGEQENGLRIAFHISDPLDTPPRDVPVKITNYFATLFWKKIAKQQGHEAGLAFMKLLPPDVTFDETKNSIQEFVLNGKTIKDTDLPVTVEKNPELPPFVESGEAGKFKIVIFIGPSWEQWNPTSVKKTGIGGSEIAVVCMAQELTKLGHQVTVLNDCGGGSGEIYDGVRYIDYQQAEKEPERFECDVFISSRMAHAFDTKWKSKLNILWVHDTHVGQPTAKLAEQLFKVDKFFCLSKWHKQYFRNDVYRFIHPNNVVVTRNGIDLRRFVRKHEVPKTNSIIYSSSPDRGLERLLQLLPAIRDRVNDVVLHVYYGFETWRKMAESAGRKDWLEKIDFFERLLERESKKGSLVYHGRVNQEELAHGFLESKVWAYPTWFFETSCITAMEAQAAGCVPVTTALAALNETVQHGVLIAPPSDSDGYGQKFVETVLDLLTNEDKRKELADAGRRHAFANLSWSQVAFEWTEIFQKALAEKTEGTSLPAFAEDF